MMSILFFLYSEFDFPAAQHVVHEWLALRYQTFPPTHEHTSQRASDKSHSDNISQTESKEYYLDVFKKGKSNNV